MFWFEVFFEIFLLDKDGNFLNNYDTANDRDVLTPILGFEVRVFKKCLL